jgi:hypothetical protein
VLALSDATNKKPPVQDEVSQYLLKEPRILREVCRAMGGDDKGRKCPTCSVREFCESQARRAENSGAAPSPR